MDRGYFDFWRLNRLARRGAFFVTSSKQHLLFHVVRSQPVDRTMGLRCDQEIRLRGYVTKDNYPNSLRRIRFYDTEQARSLIFLTNQFTLPAIQIAELYRQRWKIELFFRWIKQHLRIRKFVGNSENAVRIQIWSAISSYLLVAILKKTLNLEGTGHTSPYLSASKKLWRNN
jgi:IS4 transposase